MECMEMCVQTNVADVKHNVIKTQGNVLVIARSDGLGYSATRNAVKDVLIDVPKTMAFATVVLLRISE